MYPPVRPFVSYECLHGLDREMCRAVIERCGVQSAERLWRQLAGVVFFLLVVPVAVYAVATSVS